MADLYPSIQFPTTTFGQSLATLPALMEESRGSRAREQTLAELNPNDPQSMLRMADQLIAKSPTTHNIEIALTLRKSALDKLEYERRKAEGEALSPVIAEQYKRILGGGNLQAPPTSSGTIPVIPPLSTPPGVAPQAPGFEGAVNPLAPRSALPSGPQVALNTTPLPPTGPGAVPVPPGGIPLVPRSPGNPLSPPPLPPPGGPPGQRIGGVPETSADIIAAAQGGGLPPAPPAGPPTAQAGLPSGLGVPPAPPGEGGLPSWMQGAQVRPDVRPPPPPLTAESISKTLGPPPSITTDPALRERLNNIFTLMNQLPRKPSPALAALRQEFDRTVAMTAWSPEEKTWQRSNLERWMKGQETRSYDQYVADKAVTVPRYEEAQKAYEGYAANSTKAQRLSQDLDVLGRIVEHPAFISGRGSEYVAKLGSALTAAVGVAKAFGITDTQIGDLAESLGAGRDLRKITDPTKLQEVFNAISNQAIYSKLGSLGNQISNSDRTFVQAANPSLLMSKQGNAMLIKIMKALADRDVQIGKIAENYRTETGADEVNAPTMHRQIREYNEKHRLFENADGTLTPLGKEVDAVSRPSPPDLSGQPRLPVPLGGGTLGRADLGMPTEAPPSPTPATAPVPAPVAPPAGPGLGSLGPFPTTGEARVLSPPGSYFGPSPVSAPESAVAGGGDSILPEHEGKIYFRGGRAVGRIVNGVPVPFKYRSRGSPNG